MPGLGRAHTAGVGCHQCVAHQCSSVEVVVERVQEGVGPWSWGAHQPPLVSPGPLGDMPCGECCTEQRVLVTQGLLALLVSTGPVSCVKSAVAAWQKTNLAPSAKAGAGA
jgi:hypothetical protein